MKNITLEELGWELDIEVSDIKYLVYKRDEEVLYINLDKKKIAYSNNEDYLTELTFATLEAIRNLIIENALF